MTFTEFDRMSPTWVALKKHLEDRLANMRAKNDNESLDALSTASMRGRIAEIKAILSLGVEPPEKQ